MAEANGWYIKVGGREIGPLSTERLKRLAIEGEITANTYVRRSIDKTWYPASQIKNLLPLKPAAYFRPPEPSAALPQAPSSPSVSHPPSIVPSPASQSTVSARTRSSGHLSSLIPVIVGFACLIVGYFSGRAHLKYEMKTALSKIGEEFGNAMGIDKSTEAGSTRKPSEGNTPSHTAMPSVVPMRVAHVGEGFALTIDSASIGKVSLRDFGDTLTESVEDALIITMRIDNTDERRMLTYRDNMFMGHFKLRDDVGNVVRGVTYGITARPTVALASPSDIDPQTSVGHAEVFNIPLPKTRELSLVVDLGFIGKTGDVRFTIPTNEIVGFVNQ